MTTTEHQPRERAVPCHRCGLKRGRNGRPDPKTMTWNVSALCDFHEQVDTAQPKR